MSTSISAAVGGAASTRLLPSCQAPFTSRRAHDPSGRDASPVAQFPRHRTRRSPVRVRLAPTSKDDAAVTSQAILDFVLSVRGAGPLVENPEFSDYVRHSRIMNGGLRTVLAQHSGAGEGATLGPQAGGGFGVRGVAASDYTATAP